MLNRRRRHQTPTFLEGTPGLYVKRESPPRVPSTAPIPSKGDVTPRSASRCGGQSNASRSLSGSHSSLFQCANNPGVVARKVTAPLGASTPALVASTHYASAASVAATTASGGVPQGFNNFSSVQNFQNASLFHQYQNQQKHQNQQHLVQSYQQFHQHNDNNNSGRGVAQQLRAVNGHSRRQTAVTRYELSSHSFNNPPSTSWAATRNSHHFGETTPDGAKLKPPNFSMMTLNELARKNSSADTSENTAMKYDRRRHLATSLSFGNVAEPFRGDNNGRSQIQNGFPMSAALSRVSTNVTANPVSRVENNNTLIPRQASKASSGGSSILAVQARSKGNNPRGTSSTSLQSLPGSSILLEQTIPSSSTVMTISHRNAKEGSMGDSSTNNNNADDVVDDGDPEAELALPTNWEVEVTPDGIRYYVDHNHRRTHWIHPLAVENLSPGWIKIFDPAHGVVYYNEVEKRSQFEHPGLATPNVQFHRHHHLHHVQQQHDSHHQVAHHHPHQLPHKIVEEFSANVSSGESPVAHPPKFVEDLNIIDDKDVPEWIRLYSEAPFESDHLLDWKMFDLSQLEEFDQMLMKLFKQDAINTVIKYERPRREINDTLKARNVIS